MTYEAFQNHIMKLVVKSADDIGVEFSNDTEKGLYTARCSNGIRFFGNSSNLKLTARWDHNHQAQFSV